MTAGGAASTGVHVGRYSQLDAGTLAKVEAGCNYINAEIAKVRRRVLLVAGIGIVLGLVLASVLWNRGIRDPRAPIGIPLALVVLYAGNEHRKLKKAYKHIVVSRVVKALGHGLTYSPESAFTKQDFLDMDLFEKRTEQWRAEDEICGRKNAVSYSVLEARATRTEGSGKNRRTVVIFRGVIVRLDFNKHFRGHTVVVPDAESRILGGLFGESETRRRKQIARLENVEFEKLYSVYCTDQQECRYILTPKLMELILHAQATLGVPVRLSFHDNSVFMTIPQHADRFEMGAAMFSGKVTPEGVVGDLAAVVQIAERLVDVLDLETRIWTRE